MSTSMGISTAAEPTPAERKRQRILEAAGHCFASDGFAKTTVEEIARQAGVSKGLVYVHFRSKEEVLEAVLDQTLEEWQQVTSAEVDRCAAGICQTIAVMHQASVAYARSHPVLRTILNRDTHLLLHFDDERARQSMESWRLQLIELLEQGVKSGELRPDLDIERTADVIRLLHLSFLDRLFSPGPVDVSDERLVDASVDVLLHGIARLRPRRRSSS